MTAELTMIRTPAETKLAEQFRTLRAGLAPGTDTERRDAAFARFAAKGLPHRRIEAWHYTDLRGLLREPFQPAAGASDDASAAAKAWVDANPVGEGYRVVLVDGVFAAGLSTLNDLPPGVTIGVAGPATPGIAAAEALGKDESILALNAAFAGSSLAVTLAAGAAFAETLDLTCIASGDAARAVAARVVVTVGDHASLTLVERHVGLTAADSQTNVAFVFDVGNGASVDHAAIIEGLSAGSLHIGSTLARLGADTRLTTFTLTATPGLVRRQSFVEFTGEQSSISLNGVSLLDGRAHADTTLVVTHTAPHCESREYFKTILDGESTGVYQGKVIVAPGAQKTDGKMMSRAIFLADGASMFNKPELEIFADDVVCGHGATVGYLDAVQLFYLRSRGIPMKQAQSMLLNAFAADAIENVANETLRDQLTGSVERWLAKRQS
jgi:Fe-S cluster assembly protein SufD